MKKRVLKLTLVASLFILTSCVKKALDSAFDSVKCAQSYSDLAQSEAGENCPGTVENIDAILANCSAFLTSSQREELEMVKAECQGN
ncbi:MAG: hypothetical protein AB8B59_04540 [Maribacter sp.]